MPRAHHLLLLFFCVGLSAQGQDSTVPESVRQMLLRSQAQTQYEQMARMQVEANYRDFLDALDGDEHRARVEAALLGVLAERAQASGAVASGQAGSAGLQSISDYGYLREKLEPLLSSAELATLDARQGGPSDEQLKRQYAAELSRSAPGLTEDSHAMVLDTLVRHLQADRQPAASMARMSVDELVQQQLQSIMDAGAELQGQLPADQWQQASNFIRALQSNLYRNRSMLDGAQ